MPRISVNLSLEMADKSKYSLVELENGKWVTPDAALRAYVNRGIKPRGSFKSVMNGILGTYGMEYIPSTEDTMTSARGIEYFNTGDSYCTTLCWFRGRMKVCSWADIVEKHPNLFP